MTNSNSREPAFAQFRWRHKDGSWRDLETAFTNLIDDVTVSGVVLNSRDVTEQTALQNQLSHQAFHDPLTDLANRALFRDRVEHSLERRRALDEQVAVLFLDVDDFKTLNDSLGHSAGDELLRELADRIVAASGSEIRRPGWVATSSRSCWTIRTTHRRRPPGSERRSPPRS